MAKKNKKQLAVQSGVRQEILESILLHLCNEESIKTFWLARSVSKMFTAIIYNLFLKHIKHGQRISKLLFHFLMPEYSYLGEVARFFPVNGQLQENYQHYMSQFIAWQEFTSKVEKKNKYAQAPHKSGKNIKVLLKYQYYLLEITWNLRYPHSLWSVQDSQRG